MKGLLANEPKGSPIPPRTCIVVLVVGSTIWADNYPHLANDQVIYLWPMIPAMIIARMTLAAYTIAGFMRKAGENA